MVPISWRFFCWDFFMNYDEEGNRFIHNIDKVISYLIKNTDTDIHNTPNYGSLLSELSYPFRQMHPVNMSHYNTWRFKYNGSWNILTHLSI